MPPEQDEFQVATEDFRSARLFGAAEPLLKAIESRGRMHDEFMILYSR